MIASRTRGRLQTTDTLQRYDGVLKLRHHTKDHVSVDAAHADNTAVRTRGIQSMYGVYSVKLPGAAPEPDAIVDDLEEGMTQEDLADLAEIQVREAAACDTAGTRHVPDRAPRVTRRPGTASSDPAKRQPTLLLIARAMSRRQEMMEMMDMGDDGRKAALTASLNAPGDYARLAQRARRSARPLADSSRPRACR